MKEYSIPETFGLWENSVINNCVHTEISDISLQTLVCCAQWCEVVWVFFSGEKSEGDVSKVCIWYL